jgi:gluconolactonase
LYVVDSSTPYIYVYDANPGGQARNGRIFADLTPASSDGIRCDEDGNLWASVAGGEPFDGVYVFDLDGARIGHVMLPERCANLCFGGPVGNRLFMAASQSVYALYVNTRGC